MIESLIPDGHHWDRAPAMLRESAERIERLAGNLRDCREVLRSTDEALQDSACEIERLTRERDHYLEHGNLRQMSEIERLRAALEKIATDEPSAVCTVGCNEIAREVLRSSPCLS